MTGTYIKAASSGCQGQTAREGGTQSHGSRNARAPGSHTGGQWGDGKLKS
jgi:hypothetical protein